MAVTEAQHPGSGTDHASKPDNQGRQQATGTSTPAPPMPFPPKDCRACSGAQHMINAFKRMSTLKGEQEPPDNGQRANHATTLGGGFAMAAAAASERQAPAPAAAQPSSSSSSSSAYEPMPCPPETSELGNASWTLLHSMAAYYPERPTGAQRSLMRSWVEGLAEFYPCSMCAEHLQQQIQDSPPDVSSGTALSLWMCKIHNEVNEMLGKPIFDCSKVMQRWRDGPPDGSCG